MGTPFALDFGAVMMVAHARNIDVEMLSDVLAHVERSVITGLTDDEGGHENGS